MIFEKKINDDPFSIILGGGILLVASLPSLYFFEKHGKKLIHIRTMKKNLKHPDIKIYKGLLNNRNKEYIIQKTIMSKYLVETNYYGAVGGTGSVSPIFINQDQTINKKFVRELFIIERFDGLEVPQHKKSEYMDFEFNPSFRYWLTWNRHRKNESEGDYVYDIYSIYANEKKPFTVAYKVRKDFIEYFAVCDGEGDTLDRHIEKEEKYSAVITGVNTFTIAYIVSLFINGVVLI